MRVLLVRGAADGTERALRTGSRQLSEQCGLLDLRWGLDQGLLCGPVECQCLVLHRRDRDVGHATYLRSAEIGESGCTAFLKSFSCCKMEGPRGRRIFVPAVLMGNVAPILAVRQTASKLRLLAVGERWRNSGAWSFAVSGMGMIRCGTMDVRGWCQARVVVLRSIIKT
jgi:hypothetical protein